MLEELSDNIDLSISTNFELFNACICTRMKPGLLLSIARHRRRGIEYTTASCNTDNSALSLKFFVAVIVCSFTAEFFFCEQPYDIHTEVYSLKFMLVYLNY